MEPSSIIAIILFPVLTLIFGSIGGIITAKKIPSWYNLLNKPKLNPPNWIFGPVWTLLYISIGFSGYIFWSIKKEFDNAEIAAWFFYFFQILLNFLWTPIFFGLNYLLLAGFEIILVDLCTLINIILFCQKSVLSGCILIPYMLWISFATYLTFGIWYLNRNTEKKNIESDVKSKIENKNQIEI